MALSDDYDNWFECDFVKNISNKENKENNKIYSIIYGFYVFVLCVFFCRL